MILFEVFREDYDIQWILLGFLIKIYGDSDGCEELFEKVKKVLISYVVVEEWVFYILMMELDMIQEKVCYSVVEYYEIDELVEELEDMDFSLLGWLVVVKKFQELVMYYLDEEEQEVFQFVG